MKRRMMLGAFLAAFLVSSPLLAEEVLMTKIYFQEWLKTATGPLEARITALQASYDQMQQAVAGLRSQLSTEIKVVIGLKTAWVDGQSRSLDVAPVVQNGRTMVPVRFIGEALGADFSWDQQTSKVTYTLGDTVLELSIGKKTARVNGKDVALDVAPTLVEGRTLVPLRFIGQYMGAEVEWDGQAQMASIYR